MEHSQSFYNQLKSVQLAYDLSLSYVRSLYKNHIGVWASKQIETDWKFETATQETINILNEIKGGYCNRKGFEFNHPYMKSWVDHELLRVHGIKC